MMQRILAFTLVLGSFALGTTAPAKADPVTGSYTLGGATTGTGPWSMTTTDSTYSILRLVFDSPVLFQDLTSIVIDYTNNNSPPASGIAAGAPRLELVTDGGAYFGIQFGPAGSFVDNTAGPGSTGNLLALTDNGRYDLTGIGGSVYTDRAAALTAAGLFSIVRATLVMDSFGGADRNFTINSFTAEKVASPVPLPAAAWLLLSGLGGLGALARRRKLAAV